MARRGTAIVLAASLAAHVALLAAWMSTRPDALLAEPPPMEVQLVRLPPPAPHPRPAASPPKTAPIRSRAEVEPPPPDIPPAPPPPVKPRVLTDPELLAGFHTTPQQMRDGPLTPQSWDSPPRPQRPKCKPAEGYPGPPLPCPGELMKDPNRPFDVDRDAPDSDLAREGRYKRAMKRYHELPGGAGYPGVACAMFHRC